MQQIAGEPREDRTEQVQQLDEHGAGLGDALAEVLDPEYEARASGRPRLLGRQRRLDGCEELGMRRRQALNPHVGPLGLQPTAERGYRPRAGGIEAFDPRAVDGKRPGTSHRLDLGQDAGNALEAQIAG